MGRYFTPTTKNFRSFISLFSNKSKNFPIFNIFWLRKIPIKNIEISLFLVFCGVLHWEMQNSTYSLFQLNHKNRPYVIFLMHLPAEWLKWQNHWRCENDRILLILGEPLQGNAKVFPCFALLLAENHFRYIFFCEYRMQKQLNLGILRKTYSAPFWCRWKKCCCCWYIHIFKVYVCVCYWNWYSCVPIPWVPLNETQCQPFLWLSFFCYPIHIDLIKSSISDKKVPFIKFSFLCPSLHNILKLSQHNDTV